MAGEVRLEGEGAIARVVLAHAGRLNAMSRAMWRELRDVFLALAQQPHRRCVVVQGAGTAFCAGGDIAEYPAFRFDRAELRHFHEVEVWGGLQAMLDCDLPLLAQIDGPCIGAGLEIASCCDLRLAADDASFGAPIARLGFPMAPREAQLVARVVGEATAREMLLSAAVLGAVEMKSRGFLHQVMPQAALAERVQALAERIATLSPQAARLNKQTLRALSPSADPSGRIEAQGVAAAALANAYAYADSAEHREGIAAFLDKRKPVF